MKLLTRLGAYRGVVLIGLTAISAMFLVACSGGTDTPTAQPTDASGVQPPAGAQYGGRLNFPIGRDPAALDVHQTSGGTDGWILAPLHGQLLRPVPNVWTEIEADIASAWEVTEGGAHWTFTIRDNGTWHDGQPITVDDVVYSLNRMHNPPEGTRVGVGSECLRDFAETIVRVDDSTVRIELKAPAVSFHTCITKPHVRILPKHVLEPVDMNEGSRDLQANEMTGSGPFVYRTHERGSQYVYDRNENYYVAGRPYLDGITMYVMPEASTQAANFIAGTVDFVGMFPGLTPQEAEDLRNQTQGRASVVDVRGVGITGAFLNTASGPFSDIRLRQAAHLATDREEFLELIGGGRGYIQAPITPHFGYGYDFDDYLQMPGWRFDKTEDMAEAIRLVNEATNGQGVDVTLALRRVVQDQALILQQQWNNVGFRVNIEVHEDAILRERAGRGEFNAVVEGSGFQVFDPDGAFLRHFVPGVPLNWSQWDNAEFVGLFEQQAQETNRAERERLMREIADLLEREVPVVGTATGFGVLGISNRVQNYVPPPAQLDLRWDWIWMSE